MQSMHAISEKPHMNISRAILRFLLAFIAIWAVFTFGASEALATSCATGGPTNCNSCISSQMFLNIFSGQEIITAMFTDIDNVLNTVEYDFYHGIITAAGFQEAIGAAIVIYVAIYGLMIVFGISSYRVNEVAARLMKVGIVYMFTSPAAWTTFDTWVNKPVVGGMNYIIREFAVSAEGGTMPTTFRITTGAGPAVSGEGLDPAAFANMFGSSMTVIFSAKMLVAIISLAFTGFWGWVLAVLLLWSLVEFFFMIIGALVTYAKAIIGLAFLFGIAPLFFIFLLFDRTRPIFQAWVSHVFAFALQPVLLFAFLSFYLVLINDSVNNLFTGTNKLPVDFCWVKFISVPGTLWDMSMWRATHDGAVIGQETTDTLNKNTFREPISVTNALYFLMLCHLGRTFNAFIGQISEGLTGGMGPGVTRGADVRQAMTNKLKKSIEGMRGGE